MIELKLLNSYEKFINILEIFYIDLITILYDVFIINN